MYLLFERVHKAKSIDASYKSKNLKPGEGQRPEDALWAYACTVTGTDPANYDKDESRPFKNPNQFHNLINLTRRLQDVEKEEHIDPLYVLGDVLQWSDPESLVSSRDIDHQISLCY